VPLTGATDIVEYSLSTPTEVSRVEIEVMMSSDMVSPVKLNVELIGCFEKPTTTPKVPTTTSTTTQQPTTGLFM